MTSEYDVGVVGAGILGLAHAYQLARHGLRVLVLERHPQARGASVRNFGMIWPVGQAAGPNYRLARRSRELWLNALTESGLWHERCGSLHVAYREDEAQVLREFVAESMALDRPCELLSPAQARGRIPMLNPTGLRAALWSPTELAVDPRQIIAELPAWLTKTYGVDFAFGTNVLSHNLPQVLTPTGARTVRRLVICAGSDFRDLFPVEFAASGLVNVKLQMMRSAPLEGGVRVGAHLAAGLTLCHYPSFATCPTLPALAKRLDREWPEQRKFGVHVLVSQNGHGELTLGDSHEYGDEISPFDKPHIDQLVLDYLQTFLPVPKLAIASRWHGSYLKHPTDAFFVAHLSPNVIAVNGAGGAGMTLSFGLAEQAINDWLGAKP